MSSIVYKNKEYIIVKEQDNYIIINTKKDFNQGHTHIKNYNIAKTIVRLCKNSKMPKSKNKYIVNSIIRISNDNEYTKKLKEIK